MLVISYLYNISERQLLDFRRDKQGGCLWMERARFGQWSGTSPEAGGNFG